MPIQKLTLRDIKARPVLLKLKRPVTARIAEIPDWPLILLDLETEEGVTGRAYLEPYIPKSMRYLVPAINDMADLLRGQTVAPFDFYQTTRKSLHFVGYEGLSMIAVAGVDMAAWDALARADERPLCELLGGSVAGVPAYNSNGLWLKSPDAVAAEAVELVAEGNFRALKLRMGRERLKDDVATLHAVRRTIGAEISIMVDFNQGLHLGEALERCHAVDDAGLAWLEEPIAYDNFDGYARLAADLKTPLQIGENFYGPRDMHKALRANACDYVMPDFMRIGGVSGWLQAAGIAAAAGIPISTHLYPEVGAHVMRVSETAHWLEWQDWANPVLVEPYIVRDGMLEIPRRPGLGLEWDEQVVARHLVE